MLTAILLAPLARSGYLLAHDMVFTPRQPLDLAALGVSSASPRAVPLDALVGLAERVVTGAVIGRLAVVLPLVVAAAGCAVVLRRAALPGVLAGSGLAVWNAYVTERLALGQWALLWTYAALPWLLIVVQYRREGRGRWAARAIALAAGSITPTGGLIMLSSALGMTSVLLPRREAVRTVGLAVVLQAPWVVPAAVSTAATTSDPAAVSAFAARAEHPGGPVLSLLGGGGIWDADVVPSSRGGALAWITLAVLGGAVVLGWRPLATVIGNRGRDALAAIAAGGFLLAGMSSVPSGAGVLRSIVMSVPGAGLLRDSQKFLLPLVIVQALLVGAAVDRLARKYLRWRSVIGVAAAVLPILLLPDAAATLRPTLTPVHYPNDWSVVAAAARGGDAVVFPLGSYRTFPWVHVDSVLDPAPRWLPVPTVVDDRLAVSGRLLAGEDPRARAVVDLAASAGSDALALRNGLARLGFTWVVVEGQTPGIVPPLSALTVVHRGTDVSLYRVPGARAAPGFGAGRVTAVVMADVIAAGVLVIVLAGATRPRGPRRRRSPLL